MKVARTELTDCLPQHGVSFYESHANFVLIKWAKIYELINFLTNKNIMVRDRTKQMNGIGHVRVTVGSLANTRTVIDVRTAYFNDAAQ